MGNTLVCILPSTTPSCGCAHVLSASLVRVRRTELGLGHCWRRPGRLPCGFDLLARGLKGNPFSFLFRFNLIFKH
jgi:hypothetical protein